DRGGRRRLLCREERGSRRDNHVDLHLDELGNDLSKARTVSLRPPCLERNGTTLDPAEFAQSLRECGMPLAVGGRCAHAPVADGRKPWLLRARRERPSRRTADQRDELPASHSRPQGSKPRTASSHSRPGLGTGRGGCELRPIVLVWECRLWVPRPGQNRESSVSANAFPLCPRKRTSRS